MTQQLKNFSLIIFGCLIAALGFNVFMTGNNIVAGGVSGLAISIHQLFGWPVGTFTLIANIPLLLLCYFFLGKKIFFSTLVGAWLYPIFINLTLWVPNLTENQLLAALFGGAIIGLGFGMVFLGNSSTGGSSIPIKILEKYTPLSLGQATALIDGLIVLSSFIAFDTDAVLYAIIAVLVMSYVINLIIAGFESSKNIMVISDHYQDIKTAISQKADRGVTEIPVIGGYTSHKKRMLMVTVLALEVPSIERLIMECDPYAFTVIMPASQVHGRGFNLTKHYHFEENDLLPPV